MIDSTDSMEKLIELLELKGFEGMDVSIEESLLYYGIVRRQSDSLAIIYTADDSKPYLFGMVQINDDFIKDCIEEMNQGFYDYLGTTKEEYLDSFDLSVKNKDNLSMYIHDIRYYQDVITYDVYCTQTIDEMIEILNHN